MDKFVISARKYRPEEFDSVVGQSHITDTLDQAIANGQLAQAMLFCGPRGVGKTTCARILARKINEASGQKDENSFQYNIHELDAASNNSVDNIRSLIDQVRYAPQTGRYKVYIIDEVHMLSQAAFNAFLKTLEEPPEHAIFILATTEKHKVLPTILSRCQIFEFRRITTEDILQQLKKVCNLEGVNFDEEALYLIASQADGGMRDALSLLDRIRTFTNNNIDLKSTAEILQVLDTDQYIELVRKIREMDLSGILQGLDIILSRGFDAHHFIAGLANHFRNMMFCLSASTAKLLDISTQTRDKLTTESRNWLPQHLISALDICSNADLQYKQAKNPRLLVELSLMQLMSLENDKLDKKKTS